MNNSEAIMHRGGNRLTSTSQVIFRGLNFLQHWCRTFCSSESLCATAGIFILEVSKRGVTFVFKV